MTASPNLLLPYIAAAQSQKHVTHNEAVRMLDALVQLSVLSAMVTSPPPTPLDGDRYIVPTAATGAWSGRHRQVAAFQDGAWAFFMPRNGWRAYVVSDGAYVFDGTAWVRETASPSVNPVSLVGVSTTADTTNRLAVASPATLFNHAGNGHQLKINKSGASDTAAILLQTGFSGRAECGLTGDDDFHLKVSADGSTWTEAVVVERATGRVHLPETSLTGQANLLINGGFQVNQRAFAGGTLASGAVGHDRWRALGGAAQYTVSNGTVTLTSGRLGQVVELAAHGLASLAGQHVTISVEGLSGGSLTVTVGTVSGTITPGAGRRAVSLSLGAVAGPTISVSIEPVSSAVSFARVKMELGKVATAWPLTDLSLEQLRCQRYYWRIIGPISMVLYAQGAGNYFFNNLPLPIRMRTTPAVSRVLLNSGNIFQNDLNNVTAVGQSDNSLRLSIRANAAGECYATISEIACDAEL